MTDISREVEVLNENGIHVRPSSQIVETSQKFLCKLAIANKEKMADARSVIELLQLEATQGTKLVIRGNGEDAERAVEALVRLFSDRFGFES